jgi:uncharacterized protein (TIGR02118 family)
MRKERFMIKMVAMVKRKEGMEREKFIRYWLDVHAPLEAKWPGLKRYVISPAIGVPGGGEPQFDGVAELWFKDEEAMNRALESPERSVSREDFLKFVGAATMIVTEERVIVDEKK